PSVSSREVEFVQKEEAERKRLEDTEKAHLEEIQRLQVRIAALESELMQLMKQNGIQMNNNNNSAQQQSPGMAGPARELSEVVPHAGSRQRLSRGLLQDSISSTEGEVRMDTHTLTHSTSSVDSHHFNTYNRL
ncbi:unnamed protein product, partial [Oncorhynchus mykiss]